MKKLFFISLFFLQTIYLTAQNDTIKTTLKEVVVAATRTETPFYTIASSVSVIGADEISRRQHNSVVEILREIPGLTIIQQGGPGKLANLFMRGANSNHVLVLIDGTEMNDPSSPNNAFDFSSLSTDDIERIEIIRGPQSTLYGSDAIAGVISIFTRHGSKERIFNLSTEGGSNNFFKTNLNTSGNYKALDYFVSLNRISTDGISVSNSKYGNNENDGFTNSNLSAKLGINLENYGYVKLLYKFTSSKTDLDQSEKLGDDPNYIYNIEEQIFNLSYNLNSFNNKWEKIFRASYIKRFNKSLDDFDNLHQFTYSDSYNNASRIKFDWQNNLRILDNHLITVGIETERERANTSFISESQWGPYTSVFPIESVTTTGIYLQDQINLFNSLFTSIGLRLDKHQKFGSVTTFRFAPAYFINDIGLKIKFTYGTGFKAPSLFYLFDPAWGNPDLKPEKSKGWDLGIEKFYFNNQLTVGISYFDLKLENMFGFDSNFRTVNIAKASSKGVEFYGSILNHNNISANINYTFTETKDLFEGSADYNKQLLRRPKHQASLNINYRFNDAGNLNAGIRYIGKREDKDFSSFPVQRVTLPDYYLINIAASYKVLEYLQLTGRIENLFNKDYEEVLYYGTLGRSFYLGLNLNL
ncbi:MAG: TonB-dependent receptor [Ignavibacteria bacterium]|nr:TonB-dependent receptor [Ignavibacteria bacterium]